MFEWLTKSKFYTKCKSLIRMTKTRVEGFKRKKNTVVKFLKNDMADLLKAGLDYNAYDRAEGLLVELNVMACYDLIEQFCGCITANLSVMNKQKGCPEECKEAVQSLIYAAARFAEFPELRGLRSLLVDRYGTSLELFINKEFVEKLKGKPVTKDMKLQLMHDIANEFSIQWSSKSLEQKLFIPHPPQQHAFSERNVLADNNDNDDEHKREARKDDAYTWKDSYDVEFEVNDKEHSVQNKNENEHGFFVRKKLIEDSCNLPSSSEDEASSSQTRDSSNLDGLRASSSSMGSVSEDEEDNNKKNFSYGFIPPPYLKPIVEKEENKVEVPLKLADNICAERVNYPDDASENKMKPRSVRTRRPIKPPPDREYADRPLKPPPVHEQVGIAEILVSSRNSSVGKQEGKWLLGRVLQADNADQRNEEEKRLDVLLKHYSEKDSPHEMNQQSPLSREATDVTSEVRTRRNAKSELPSLRSEASYSVEPVTPNDAIKRHGRAFSLQPETLDRHVHPNLPDYDELAALVAVHRIR